MGDGLQQCLSSEPPAELTVLVWTCVGLCSISPHLPKDNSSTSCNPAVKSSHPALMEYSLPSQFELLFHFAAFVRYVQTPALGRIHKTMSRATICVLTGSAGGCLWIAAKTIHSHRFPHTPMLFHFFILETQGNSVIYHCWNSCKYFCYSF